MSVKNAEKESLYEVASSCKVLIYPFGLIQNHVLMTVTKKGFSSKETQKQLGLKRYEPVWTMTHKFRKAMKNIDAPYTLEGLIEFNKTYFTVESSEIEQEKRALERGAVGKTNLKIKRRDPVQAFVVL